MPEASQLLADARDYARRATSFVEGIELAGFANDERTKSAVCFCLIVVAEACNLSRKQLRNPPEDIPWDKIKGMRNILAHSYWPIDDATVYKVARDEASALADRLNALIEQLAQP